MARKIVFVGLNVAGKHVYRVGVLLHRTGLALCGLAGTIDAEADQWR